MAKQTDVLICDRCNQRIATRNCFLCDNDLCNYCGSKTDLWVRGIDLRRILDLCPDCVPKVKDLIKENPDEIIAFIKESIHTDFRKRLILKKLKD